MNLTCQRHAFGLPRDLHYLNCAYMAPVSDRVQSAAHRAVELLRAPSQIRSEDFFGPSDRVRRLFAELIQADDYRRVAIIPSVSYAMATVARNTPLEVGDNVVVVHEQFPSNVYTWKRACDATGATLRIASPGTAEDDRADAWNAALVESIDERTKLVTIPHLHWADGTRFDLDRVAQRVHAVGGRLVIDGTQSVGALPFDVRTAPVDAVVCAGYKWLMGPYAIGLAYFGDTFDDGVPIEENWITRRGSEDLSALVHYSDEYQAGAVRFDVGERSNFILLPMLEAGLSQVLEWGADAIQVYCEEISAEAIRGLRDLGYRVDNGQHRAAHLFGVRLPLTVNRDALHAALAKDQVSVSFRGDAVRVSPHVYNNASDLDALVQAAARGVSGAT